MGFGKTQHTAEAILIFIFLFFRCSSTQKELLQINPENIIPINKGMIINESALGNVATLVDEQIHTNDNTDLNTVPIHTYWKSAHKKWQYPVHAFIDLGAVYNLQGIYIYTSETPATVDFQVGRPFNWRKIFQKNCEKNNWWKFFSVKDTSRFLRITLLSENSPGEIILTGKKIIGDKSVSALSLKRISEFKPIQFDQFMGINALIDDPLEMLTCVSNIREYHNWYWDEGDQYKFGSADDGSYQPYPNNKAKFQPSYAGGGKWFFDDYYSKAKNLGFNVIPTYMGSVDWISDYVTNKPIYQRKDSTDPLSYAAHAAHLFQVVARYGKTRHATANLKLAADQPTQSGLSKIKFIENWNEPDAWWDGPKSYFSPYEFAAMSSADYDGHMKKLDQYHGIKNADLDCRMVMGGLTYLNIDYVKAMKLWCMYYRSDGNIPFDVLNFHHYSNIDEIENKRAISPEEDSLKVKVKKLVNFKNEYFPNKELWISEFGYDTHPLSVQGVPEIGNYTREEVQGQWIVRSYLALAAAGVDRAYMYMFRDVTSYDKTKFATSGLVLDQAHKLEKKASWYYVNTLKSKLKGFSFIHADESKERYIYHFKNLQTGQILYAIWIPSSVGRINRRYKLKCDKKYTKANIVSFKKMWPEGICVSKTITNHHLAITISEDPILIIPQE